MTATQNGQQPETNGAPNFRNMFGGEKTSSQDLAALFFELGQKFGTAKALEAVARAQLTNKGDALQALYDSCGTEQQRMAEFLSICLKHKVDLSGALAKAKS